jgi:hypothetical protein
MRIGVGRHVYGLAAILFAISSQFSEPLDDGFPESGLSSGCLLV